MATETKTFYPSGYEDKYTTSDSGIGKPVGKGADNTDSYANLAAERNITAYCYWPFNVSEIPADATIDSVSCTARASVSSTSSCTANLQLYSGSTAKGSATRVASTASTKYTLSVGNWTRAELNSVRLYTSVRSTASSGSRSIYFYGADLTVQYTYQSEKFMLKLGGAWHDIARVFKKVSGIWVEQEELANVIEDGVRYKNGGEYVAPKKTVTIKGTGDSSSGYVTINGTKYTSAATVRVEGGTTVGITLDCTMYNLMCKVTLNGTVVHENSTTNAETYYHIVDSDCTITLADNGYTGYKADIVTN